MKVAIVYDRVNKWGGAERVLLALHEIFPKAPLYTSVFDVKKAPWAKIFPKIYTSFIQKIPFAKNWHEGLGWLMPLAFEQFNFDEYDLVISVTSEAAKGIITKPWTKHICYCLTPTRYLWSHYEDYFKGQAFKVMTNFAVSHLKRWDKIAANRPDKIIAISTEVQTRIKKYYKRDSLIIYPPVDLRRSQKSNIKLQTNSRYKTPTHKYYLIISRLVKYKKVDLVVETFNKLNKPLVIIGTGREEKKLKSISKSKKIKFVGQTSEKELEGYYQNAKALIMPQEEDFGIVSIEAQSYGIPVIAYKKGGALDTVVEGKTGVFFGSQNKENLTGAIKRFEKIQFLVDNLFTNAKRFNKKSFQEKILRLI